MPLRTYILLSLMDWTGNIGNIPLVIIGAICRDDGNPFGLDPETCNSDGVAYISFGQWVGAVIVYTFVYHMLAPPKDAIALHENEELCDEIDIKVESMNSEHANGFSGSILLEDIQKDDSLSVPLLLPRSSDTLPKVRVTNSVFNSLKSCCMFGVSMTTLPNLDIST
jgi:hypothetical protein